jgi:hypothetical protein
MNTVRIPDLDIGEHCARLAHTIQYANLDIDTVDSLEGGSDRRKEQNSERSVKRPNIKSF